MPRSKKQYQNMIEERCQDIQKAALRVFALKGYNAVGMDDISKEANCSRALIYHYYPTKEDLFRKVMRQVASKIHAITESVDYSKSPEVALKELLALIFDKIDDNSCNCEYACMFYLILNLHLQGKNVPQPLKKESDEPLGKKRIYQIVYYLVEDGQKKKVFSQGDVKKYTISILAMMNGLAYNKIFLKEKFTYPDVDMIMKIVKKEGNE